MNTKPYVGITGITSREQSKAILALADEIGWPRSHRLMIGALVSYRGLVWGEAANPKQYVPVDRIDEVLIGDGRLLNLVHYNSRAAGLFAQIRDVIKRVSYADGIQLNIAWPREDQLRRLRERIYTTVVLQVSSNAYRMLGNSPAALVGRLKAYEGLIEYVLVDPSGGIGRQFDLAYAEEILGALVESGLGMKWGIAGGLGSDNISRLEALVRIYPELSWDAQARLRKIPDDTLDMTKVRAYLEASAELIR